MSSKTTTKTKRCRPEILPATQIDGWMTSDELGLLYDLAREAGSSIVEIGSHQGRSTTALALGSMAGGQHPVYAVDSFVGVSPNDRKTDKEGIQPGWQSSSPEKLRSNLDAAGVNGLVRIVPLPSAEATRAIPDAVDLLFVDGDHSYAAVLQDLCLYLPRVRHGGIVVMHDVTTSDPGVERAVDEVFMQRPHEWRPLGRIDSAVVMRRCCTTKRTVGLGCPGKSFCWGAVQGMLEATLGAHEVRALSSGTGWDDFNAIWAMALNMAESGEITHFAMLHSDVVPHAGWIDILVDELEERGADLVSTAIPIKDTRGLTSCGIGDPDNRWSAFRRFTVREILKMPPTFGLADTPHPDKILLHNTGCWLADLRSPLFFETDTEGALKCWFDFPTRVSRLPSENGKGKWSHSRESEDWFFSRRLHEAGARTFITRRVRLSHRGDADYSNFVPFGIYEHDEDTRPIWDGTEVVK